MNYNNRRHKEKHVRSLDKQNVYDDMIREIVSKEVNGAMSHIMQKLEEMQAQFKRTRANVACPARRTRASEIEPVPSSSQERYRKVRFKNKS